MAASVGSIGSSAAGVSGAGRSGPDVLLGFEAPSIGHAYLRPMYFAGVDLAWAGRNPTGVAVTDDDGLPVDASGAKRCAIEVHPHAAMLHCSGCPAH